MSAVVGCEPVNDVGYYRAGGGGGGVAIDKSRQAMQYYHEGAGFVDPPGKWGGKLAERFDLSGQDVDGDLMDRIYRENVSPQGLPLGQAHGKYKSAGERYVEKIRAEVGADRIAELEAEAGQLYPSADPDRITLVAANHARREILGERLKEIRRSADRTRQPTLGWDLTLGVAKSITVAHAAAHWAELEAERQGDTAKAAGHRSDREAIESAIWEAHGEMMKYAESVMLSQTGRHGATGTAPTWTEAPEVLWSAFWQSTNRDDGPHLHIHTVVHNRVRCADGEYRAIDGKSLKEDRWGIAAVGELALDEALERRGIKLATRADGIGREVVGLPQETLDLFSSRSTTIRPQVAEAIEAMEQRYNRPLTKREVYSLKRHITLKTRPGKSEGKTRDELLDSWQTARQTEIGEGLGPVADLLRRMIAEGPRPAAEFSPDAVVKQAVAKMAENDSTWTRGRLRHEIQRQLDHLGGLAPSEAAALLDDLTNQALASDLVVTVAEAEGIRTPDELLGRGEHLTSPAQTRFASRETLDAEDVIRRAALTRGRFHLDEAGVRSWLADRGRNLSEVQARAVLGIATSDAALTVLVGPPGTGKSYTTGGLAAVWGELSEGGRVQGLAVSSNAAKVLTDDGIEVTANIAQWLAAQERIAAGQASEADLRFAVRERDLILIDEASMVDERQVTAIHGYVEAVGGRVLLTGDPQQLAAIGAGGVMELVTDHAETHTLTEVRRFVEEWEADASTRLRLGDATALDDYDRHGRILSFGGKAEAKDAAALAATAERLAGRTAVVVTDTNEEAAEVASVVRLSLIEAGEVHPDAGEVELDGHGGSVSPGDDVMCRKNDYRLGVLNREVYRVQSVDPTGWVEVLDRKTGEVVTLTTRYLAEHGSLAYASTVHAAQGLTVDSCHLVTDGRIDRAGLLVAMTRGRTRNTAYVARQGEVDTSPARAEAAGEDDPRAWEYRNDRHSDSALSTLEAALNRDGGKAAATVQWEQDQARLASMSTNLGLRERATRIVCRDRLVGHLERLVAEGVLDESRLIEIAEGKSTDMLSSVLRAVEQSGDDPFTVLREAVTEHHFNGVRNTALTLSTRITGKLTYRYGNSVRRDESADGRDFTRADHARTPAEVSPAVARYFEALNEQADARQRELGTQLAQDPPGWLASLGPVPEDPVGRLAWEDRAGRIGAFREASGYADETRPIGDAPGLSRTEARAMWWDAWEALGRPEYGRAEAAMSEGQLRNRVRAWENEQRWAPTHVANAVRSTEVQAERARQIAIVSGEDPEFAQRAYEAALWDAYRLEEAHQTREAWVAETATTQAAAELAAAELRDRGIKVGEEPDRTTPAEWLASHREADRAEDAHRDVTEPDATDAVDVEVGEHLAETVEERAGDLGQVEIEVPRQDGAALRSVTGVPSEAEVAALTFEARAAADLLSYRASVEADAPSDDVIPEVEVSTDTPADVSTEVAADSM